MHDNGCITVCKHIPAAVHNVHNQEVITRLELHAGTFE